MTGTEANQGPASPRMLKHDLEALDLVAKNSLILSTFMEVSPGGRMHPGREHRAEKSVFFDVKQKNCLVLRDIPQYVRGAKRVTTSLTLARNSLGSP